MEATTGHYLYADGRRRVDQCARQDACIEDEGYVPVVSIIQSSFAVNAAKLILKMNEPPYSCTLGEAWRPPEMAEIYAKDGRGVKNSLHIKRLAIDLNLFIDGEYQESTLAHQPFGEWWESLSPFNRWGGRWGDGNHYEQREVIKT